MGLTIAPFRLEARHYLSRRIEKVAKELFRVQVGLMMDSIAKKFEAQLSRKHGRVKGKGKGSIKDTIVDTKYSGSVVMIQTLFAHATDTFDTGNKYNE